ncbi:MAG: PD-(D/E)XK nuclease family protein [Sulfurimonadaceae bacterium]|jgi:RecB family exonuclease|nr:PD-(D/E)XK nuclease family protein [Sulfurimonadaceae bacterium]
MKHDTTLVFPSSRAIRDFQLSLCQDTLFLPNTLTMSDFLSKLCMVDGYSYVDEDRRTLLLLEAADFSNFTKLQIERNFFTFIKNSQYLFKFYEELSTELVSLDMFLDADIYAQYEEHITILIELYKNYEILCNKHKILDRIFLPNLYRLNSSYLKELGKVKVYVAGYLTNFEFQLLQESCVFAEIFLEFTTTKFNAKSYQRFIELGLEIQEGYNYTISLNRLEIVESKKIDMAKEIVCEPLSEPLLQVAFVQKKIYDFIQKGYNPSKIAVIVPDEQFAPMLKLFDEKLNFNFAMGKPFSEGMLYRKIDAVVQVLDIDSKENEARLERFGDEIYQALFGKYKASTKEINTMVLLESFSEYATTKIEKKIYQEELFKLKHLLVNIEPMPFKSLLHIFMERLRARALDDVSGGKITVMGVLETRNVSFDGVIIVDFSDSNVPKKSDKDMFLNTQVRENAKLPTIKDRENLQKHYYRMLLSHTKEVAISYVKSAQSSGSRFLKELGIEERTLYDEANYATTLFELHSPHAKQETHIELEYSFVGEEISATKLKSFLTCKRQFYYKYIMKIKNHQIPRDIPEEWEIGTAIHTALSNLYKKKNHYSDKDTLQRDLEKELDSVCSNNEMDQYMIAMYKKILQPFCATEIKRFHDGWHVEGCEEFLKRDYLGVKLIGQIDRIDKREKEISVLDYKTGSYNLYSEKNVSEATDFQLEFYYLLVHDLGSDIGCAFYDLKEAKIVPEQLLQEKIELLKCHIIDMQAQTSFVFDRCEDFKNCTYCEYALMCGRA